MAALRDVEQADDFVGALNETAQHDKCWLIMEPQAGLVESYLSGNKGIAFRRSECAGVNPVKNGLVISSLHDVLHDGSRPRNHSDLNLWLRDDQPFMFSQNVQLMKKKEDFIASAVWLKRFDRGDFSGREPLFQFDAIESSTRVCRACGGFEDGEMGVATRFYAVARRQRCCEQVKAAACGVDDRPNLGLMRGSSGTRW